jgi:TonB family protein
MEAFGLYLLKSVIWLSGFTMVFILFLRNERFFSLNRFYLIAGILTSFFFPLISVRYIVELPGVINSNPGDSLLSGLQETSNNNMPDTGSLLLAFYLSGVLFVAFMIIKQSISVLKSIKKTEVNFSYRVKLIRTADYISSFSFFSYVFVNPSVTDLETEEIVNHEMVHIRQMHWVDLVLVEMLCVLQWFNPLVWIYIRFIRQNHEYLADEVALQRTSDPAIYRAALLNQIVGSPVVSLANSFNYSLNKKRFNMMKNIINSPYRKMKIFLILPVFAIVLYAFAKPEYRYTTKETSVHNSQASIVIPQEVKGVVMHQGGDLLPGAVIAVRGTSLGTTTDAKGNFRISNVPDNASLVVSFVGFKTKVVKPVFTSDMIIKMVSDTVSYQGVNAPPPPLPPPPVENEISTGNNVPPPPPPPPGIHILENSGKSPLVVIDGKITEIDIKIIDPKAIESIVVLKDKPAVEKYGEKGKDGVIEITTIKNNEPEKWDNISHIKVEKYDGDQKVQKEGFVVVEEMPEFPGGGKDELAAWISANIKYPGEAVKNKITGQVIVRFLVSSSGKIREVKALQPVNPLLGAEAERVISSMPDWKPGKQAGKPVDVYIKIPVKFDLK